jgi:HAD superfamily hydrolase (TIGR01549 family)
VKEGEDDFSENIEMNVLGRKVVIFDLGKVLIKEDVMKMIFQFSPLALTKYLFVKGIDMSRIRNTFLEFLEKAHGKGLHSGYPHIFEKWLTGEMENQQIREHLLKELEKDGEIDTDGTKSLVKSIVNVTFQPEQFAKVMRKHTGCELLKLIPQDVELYMITNYNGEAFDHIHRTLPELFKPFKDIIVSGRVGLLKPQKEIIQYALDRWNLNASSVLYIDDELDNVETAESFGMKTIHYNNLEEAKQCLNDFLKK